MATDKSPTSNRLIAVITVSSAVILVALRFAFASYFTAITEAESQRKIAPTTELRQVKSADVALLSQGPMPIDRAMAVVARGRESTPDIIAPRPSDDQAPLVGAALLQGKAEPAHFERVAVNGDAGALPSDGGVVPAASSVLPGASPNPKSDVKGAVRPNPANPQADAGR